MLYRASGWETCHRTTTYSNLLHVSSKAGVPGSSLLYFSSLLLLMKLQVYCGHTPALASMCPVITVKQWEVCGWGEWYSIQIVTAASQTQIDIYVPSQPKAAFHHQVGRTFPSSSNRTLRVDGFSSHFRDTFHHLVRHNAKSFCCLNGDEGFTQYNDLFSKLEMASTALEQLSSTLGEMIHASINSISTRHNYGESHNHRLITAPPI